VSEVAFGFGAPPNVIHEGLANDVPVLQPTAGIAQPIRAAAKRARAAMLRRRLDASV